VKFFSDEHLAECARKRALLVAKPVEWTPSSGDGMTGDFGDYEGWTFKDVYGGWYWEEGQRIVSELMGEGLAHVQYGNARDVVEAQMSIEAEVRQRRARTA
jgi:hypothetical protein